MLTTAPSCGSVLHKCWINRGTSRSSVQAADAEEVLARPGTPSHPTGPCRTPSTTPGHVSHDARVPHAAGQAALTTLAGRLIARQPADGPLLLRCASNSSTRRRSSVMTACCSAMTASSVSRLALLRSRSVFTTPLWHNCLPERQPFRFTSASLNSYYEYSFLMSARQACRVRQASIAVG